MSICYVDVAVVVADVAADVGCRLEYARTHTSEAFRSPSGWDLKAGVCKNQHF